ncbi:Aste57867_22949 [Aphanomyces stellatus]|uniref:Aste57867_22949 protein n=1 Tax=Aphanomyces stellatus TaxID=120398 RepID=A0A485LM47_9STRA|nr:hypothetical protein As57867_022878 [Aphanomyces stellatus]VFT99599.1 Aste57867_22949 [Aphanomyces stellatus]
MDDHTNSKSRGSIFTTCNPFAVSKTFENVAKIRGRPMHFAKEDCACNAPLFSHKYLRTHRSGSLKLIRCFPHCCPIHSFGNFCTTSLDLKVANASDLVDTDVAYIHFEPTTERVIGVGDIIDAAPVHSDTRSMENLKGKWIPSLHRKVDATNHDIVYHFNENNGFGWHYGWVGTSTKAHRTCPHQMTGYIFREIVVDGKTMLCVLRRVSSPPFIVMSYRRACYFCQKHRASSTQDSKATQCECEGEFNTSKDMSLPPLASPCTAVLPHDRPLRPQPPDTHILERHLTILVAFVSIPSVHFFAAQLPTLESRVLKSLLQPLGVALGLHASQKRALRFPSVVRAVNAHDTSSSSPDLESLKTLVLDLVLSQLTLESVRQNAAFFSAVVPRLLDRDALHAAYAAWLVHVHTQLTTRLVPMGLSIDQLTMHVMDTPALARVREYVDAAAAADTSLGLDYFVAQLREVFMASTQPPHEAGLETASPLTGHWIYDKTISFLYGDSTPELDMSVTTLLRSLLMGYAFILDHRTPHMLHVKSDLRAFDSIASEFVLDQYPRVFRVFPNGESSMAPLSGLYHGDYIGQKTSTGVSLDFFSWPLHAAQPHVLRLTCAFSTSKNDQVLMLTISLGQADADATVDYAALAAIDRYATYQKAKETPVASFRLSYTRLR